jgi:hypothetical protein
MRAVELYLPRLYICVSCLLLASVLFGWSILQFESASHATLFLLSQVPNVIHCLSSSMNASRSAHTAPNDENTFNLTFRVAASEASTSQPPQSLCSTRTEWKPDGKRCSTFQIENLPIWHSVSGLLDSPDHSNLWQVDYALRTRYRQYEEGSLFSQHVAIILHDLEETMFSQLADSIEQGVSHDKEYLRWRYYSIIMMSHGLLSTYQNFPSLRAFV